MNHVAGHRAGDQAATCEKSRAKKRLHNARQGVPIVLDSAMQRQGGIPEQPSRNEATISSSERKDLTLLGLRPSDDAEQHQAQQQLQACPRHALPPTLWCREWSALFQHMLPCCRLLLIIWTCGGQMGMKQRKAPISLLRWVSIWIQRQLPIPQLISGSGE